MVHRPYIWSTDHLSLEIYGPVYEHIFDHLLEIYAPIYDHILDHIFSAIYGRSTIYMVYGPFMAGAYARTLKIMKTLIKPVENYDSSAGNKWST